MGRPRRSLLHLVSLAALSLHGTAFTQGSGDLWIALDGQPAGTPARVVLNTDLSSTEATYFDVFISGFYTTMRVGDDGLVYQDISVPGLPSRTVPGQPRVPEVHVDIGVVTTSPDASLVEAVAFDLHAFPGYLVWPSPIPAVLHEGTPPQFTRDSTLYASTSDFPWRDGYGTPVRTTLGRVSASRCAAHPVHWNPTSGTLTVAAHARFGFSHGGALTIPMALTTESANLASSGLINWNSIQSGVAVNWNRFLGAYLIVCPGAWMTELTPFVKLKKSLGFAVTVVNVPLSGVTCGQLQQIIQSWYAGTPSGNDHYCLLVGATGTAPACLDVNGQLTDKILSSVSGDKEPEIFLGRLYVSSAAELLNQVTKIVDYEIGPQINNDGNVLLVAHHEQGNYFNFEGYHENVRTRSYAQVTPTFSTCYGTNPSLGNSDITSAIAAGVGVVAYMGHGLRDRWDQWSYSNQSYVHADAAALTNGSLTPVVWSFACQTGDPRVSNSLANGFMKNTQGGGVAFYGAVDDVFGDIFKVVEDSLFQGIYSRGVTRQGQAIALAEHAAVVADSLFGFDAMYKCVLYGDPSMAIKRRNPGGIWAPIDLIVPIDFLAPCPGITCCPTCAEPTVDIRVLDATGVPVPGVKVALWKPRFAEGDEIQDNRYSDPDGWVHIPVPQLTAGTLYVGFDDGDGRAGLDSINVQGEISGVVEQDRQTYRLAASPNVTDGAVRFTFGNALDRPARLQIFGVDGRLVRLLHVPQGAAWLDWDGRDRAGRRVGQGVFFARVESARVRGTARVVVVR